MRYTLAILPLALGSMAIPGRMVLPRSSAAPSVDPSPSTTASVSTTSTTAASTSTESSTTTTTEATTTTESRQDQFTDLCEPNGMTREAWQELKIGNILGSFSEMYPKNPQNNEEIDDTKDTFLDYLAKLTGTIGDFSCNVNVGCNINVQDLNDCKQGNNPVFFFGIYAIKNFYDWQDAVRRALQTQWIHFTGKADEMVQDFTRHDVDAAGSSSFLTIMSGVLTGIAPLFGPMGTAMGEVANVASLTGSLISATQSTAADVLQAEFQHMARLEDALYNITNATDKAIEGLAKNLFETIPDNSQHANAYWSQPDSWITIWGNGTFAEPMTSAQYDVVSDSFFNRIAGSGMNECWQMDGVFLVKTTKDSLAHKKSVQDMELHSFEESTRVCNQDICYFYTKAQNPANIGGFEDDWVNAHGVDKTMKYGINAWDFGRAAEWWQDKWGSYLQVPNEASDFLSLITDADDQPPADLYVNLPVVHYDDCPTIGQWDYWGSGSEEDWFISRVAKCVQKLKGWPSSYSTMHAT